MTKEEKELLTKVLCEQLPFGVIVNASYKDGDGWKNNDRKLLGVYQHDGQVYLDGVYTSIDNVKPYLRPLSSMTKSEEFDIVKLLHLAVGEILEDEVTDDGIWVTIDDGVSRFEFVYFSEIVQSLEIFDYLNAKHFDVRGILPNGLGIAAVGNDNPYK